MDLKVQRTAPFPDVTSGTVRLESRCALRLQYRDRRLTLNELKTAITAYMRNISQADLQKVFANKIKRVQACIDARGYHFQTPERLL